MTQAPLFNSQRAYCVTPLLFPEIEFIRICKDTVDWRCLLFPLWWCNLQVNSQLNWYLVIVLSYRCFSSLSSSIQMQQTSLSIYWASKCEIEHENPFGDDGQIQHHWSNKSLGEFPKLHALLQNILEFFSAHEDADAWYSIYTQPHWLSDWKISQLGFWTT